MQIGDRIKTATPGACLPGATGASALLFVLQPHQFGELGIETAGA